MNLTACSGDFIDRYFAATENIDCSIQARISADFESAIPTARNTRSLYLHDCHSRVKSSGSPLVCPDPADHDRWKVYALHAGELTPARYKNLPGNERPSEFPKFTPDAANYAIDIRAAREGLKTLLSPHPIPKSTNSVEVMP